MLGTLLLGAFMWPLALVCSPLALVLLGAVIASFLMRRDAKPGLAWTRWQLRLFLAAFLYVLSYESLSFAGKHEGIEYEAWPDRSKVWATTFLRQGFDTSNPEGPGERLFVIFYFPLIRFDRSRGETHYLDGGKEILSRFG